MAAVVTLSASFGTGGSVIGPRVAERLHLPFVDRAIPAAVASALSVPLSNAMEHDERRKSSLGRFLTSLARAAAAPDTMFGTASTAASGIPMPEQPEQLFREETERVIHEVASTTGGVILGRAAAMVLHDLPEALHVRLDGPLEARIARATLAEGLDEETARRLLTDSDRAREAYVRHFYKADPRDPSNYHLVINATAFDIDTCVEMIVTAARARDGAATH